MTRFRCVPITTDIANRFRSSGIDDRGNTIHRMIAQEGAAPCRHCLRDARAGDVMLLGSYDLPGPRGVYWTPSPIFVHADDCPRYAVDNEVAPILRTRMVSVRAYDDADFCLYDLGEALEGPSISAAITRAIGDARTQFVNVHTAKPGCLLTRVERI